MVSVMKTREPTEAEIDYAIKALGMWTMDIEEVEDLIKRHGRTGAFTSKAIHLGAIDVWACKSAQDIH